MLKYVRFITNFHRNIQAMNSGGGDVAICYTHKYLISKDLIEVYIVKCHAIFVHVLESLRSFFLAIDLLTIYLLLIYLSEVNNYNPKVITQLIYVSTIYDGTLSTRYRHVTDTLPTRYQTLHYDMNVIILVYDTLPHVNTIFLKEVYFICLKEMMVTCCCL